MFKTSIRFVSSTSLLAQAMASTFRVSPLLAAKQVAPENATKSKVKSLRRREHRMKRQIVRDVNNFKKHQLENVPFSVDPVLGNPECGFIKRLKQELKEPTRLAHGYKREEVEKLIYGAEKARLDQHPTHTLVQDSITEEEQKKRRALMTILDMRNTNNQDRKKLAIRLAREEFQREEGDTGSPEVQAAVLTAKIHVGWDHIKKSFKDKVFNARLCQMVQQRQRILKYLKKDNPERYYYTLERLGLADDVITREFSLSKKYFQDYKVYGDKQLVKVSEKEKAKQAKFADLQKRVTSYYELAEQNRALETETNL